MPRAFSLSVSLLLSFVAAACASPPAAKSQLAVPSEATAECPRAMTLEAAAIAGEAGCLLSRYVRVDTTNPPGNEIEAAHFLRAVLARDGIGSEIIESAKGRANLIARLPAAKASGKKALLLVHHMDVVPATADEWAVPPFSGLIRDGKVWGRGSLDNKAGGVSGFLVAALIKRLGAPLDRDLVLLAVADEESGGTYGARWLLEHRPELFQDVEFVLNEGGGILELGEGRAVYGVELAQKAPLWLRVTAQGTSGHSSYPLPNPAASVLVRALARLADHAFPLLVLPEVQAMFDERAVAMPEPARSQYRALAASLAEPGFRDQFLKDPQQAAVVRNTLAITMLTGSPKENVVSERASAVLDLRLLPGQDPQLVTEELRRVMAEPSLELETILSWRAVTSSRDTALFSAITRLAQQRDPGAPVLPNVIGSFTDCNAFRAQKLTCYGFLPLHIAPKDLAGIHGKDEHVDIASLAQSVLDLTALVRDL